MLVPMPVLAAIAIAFLVLLVLAFRRRGDPDDLMRPPPAAPRARAPGPFSGQLPPEVEREVRAMLAEGQKLNAVKRVRETTGLGLKEALDLVEGL